MPRLTIPQRTWICIEFFRDQDKPARSPDLIFGIFFLWGYLKHKIWSQDVRIQPRNLRDLKQAIRNKCANLDPAMIRKNIENEKRYCRDFIPINKANPKRKFCSLFLAIFRCFWKFENLFFCL